MKQWHVPKGCALLAVDPSFETNGYAGLTPAGQFFSGSCRIEELLTLRLDSFNEARRIVLAVERPAKAYRGSVHVVRKAGEIWAADMKARWPRKVVRLNYDPYQWRKRVLGHCDPYGDGWKQAAVTYCDTVLGVVVGSEDEAEAVCLLVAMEFDAVAEIMKRDRPRKGSRKK